MLRSVVPANPAAFLNKSDSQRKRFGGYIPIGKSPKHGFIFFLLFLFKSGGSNGIHRLRNQSVMFQCVFKQNAGRTVNTARRQVRRSVPVSFGQFHCNAKVLTALCHACGLDFEKPYRINADGRTEEIRFFKVQFSLSFCSSLPASRQKHGCDGDKHRCRYNDKLCRHKVQDRPFRRLRPLCL